MNFSTRKRKKCCQCHYMACTLTLTSCGKIFASRPLKCLFSLNMASVTVASSALKSTSGTSQLPTVSYRILTISLLIGCLWPSVYCVDPKFDPSTRMRLVLVPADAQVGSAIYRLRATDEEFDYPLIFELVGEASSSTVKIESLPCTKYNSVCQANVILQRRLEPGRYYDFQVRVKDTKGGIATQLCSITATNYTTPYDLIFPHKPGIVMIPEDAKRGTELSYLIARKNPLFQKPVYLELWGSALFAIRQKIISPEATEGTIFLLGPLDFEKQAMYRLTVLANDAYAQPGQDSRNIAGIEIVVIVQDVQDQPPVFTLAPPVTKLPAGILPGDKILKVHAEDGDKGNPREIRYGLVSENNPFTSFFDVNETSGEIFLVRPLEDIVAITHVGDPVLLTVIAEEVKIGREEPPAMASTVQLAFILPERSNSAPYFENDLYISRVDENAPQGTTLTFVDPYIPRVYDDDKGKNGIFSLSLINNNGTFEISPNVVEHSAIFFISVRDNFLLDYEKRQMVTFQILAQELGPATNLSKTVNVTVYINDVNDNPPVFAQRVYTAELPENVTIGTNVVQIHADDVDTGICGRIRYTAIMGYLNTSLHLDAGTGLITVSTNNHGFDREVMPEYHYYIEARDNEGTGNRAQVPLVIKLIDVNDETPIFDKDLYEFILAADLQSFTSIAVIHAVDKDATAPNNEVRYEIINGNYDNKFALDRVTGVLTVREKISFRSKKEANARSRRQTGHGSGASIPSDTDIFILTARAYDLGVPVLFSITTIRIYPPESHMRSVTFVVPGLNVDKAKTEETLSAITGGRVIIHEIRPVRSNELNGADSNAKERSVVTATVLYDSASVVDISQIQQRLSQHNSSYEVRMTRESIETDTLYKAENKLLFWLLILLATLVAITILVLLLCCICSWCPLHGASTKRIVNISRTDDDVHLVHREVETGKQTKSVQVAEWMGRHEAWSAEKPLDPRTKSTHWEFRNGREQPNENLITNASGVKRDLNVIERTRAHSSDEQHKQIVTKDLYTAKEDAYLSSHNSRTNLINDRDVYIEDVINEGELIDNSERFYRNKAHRHQINKHGDIETRQADDDSMRRHEIDRGSEVDYNAGRNGQKHKRELYIKDGNTEILQLMTRDNKNGLNNENIYVNVPYKPMNLSNPQLLMVDNSGKEILMRRFIEEQPDGKQIIREHYQIVPGATYIHSMPNEVQLNSTLKGDTFPLAKSGPNSIVYSQNEPEVKVIHTQPAHATIETTQIQPSTSNQSLTHELEHSLKQQNALLRQILLDKEKLEGVYTQQEVVLETQSLPSQSMAIATQTDCEVGTQTEFHVRSPQNISKHFGSYKRKARSENDDSMSENEYEYVPFKPSNSSEDVCWIKRHKQQRRTKHRSGSKPRKRLIMVEEVKRKIKTPIEEEDDAFHEFQKRSPPIKPIRKHTETKTSILRRQKNDEIKQAAMIKHRVDKASDNVKNDFLDSFDEKGSADEQSHRQIKIHYELSPAEYDNEDSSVGSEIDEIIIKSNGFIPYYEQNQFKKEIFHMNDSENYTSKPLTQAHSSSEQKKYHHESIPRLSVKDRFVENLSSHSTLRDQAYSEPPPSRVSLPSNDNTKIYKKYVNNNGLPDSKRMPKPRVSQSETDLLDRGNVPKYMEWYYSKKKPSLSGQISEHSTKTNTTSIKTKTGSISNRRVSQTRLTGKPNKVYQDDSKQKLEPTPSNSSPKGTRLLKEEIVKNKQYKSAIETDLNHPLLQHSEHRFERENGPEVPVPPSKLTHYLYPETPPYAGPNDFKRLKSKNRPSPIKEQEVTASDLKKNSNKEDLTLPLQSHAGYHPTQKQLNVSALEDDHDSGIAMNSLLNSMGRRNPIAEKKSVFSIAYDDVNRVKKIATESESPQYS